MDELSAKQIGALTRGLIKILWQQQKKAEDDLTREYLCSEVFQGSAADAAAQEEIVAELERHLQHAAANDLSPEAAAEYLTANSSLAKDKREAFGKAWGKERDRVHLAALDKTGLGPQLSSVKWRVSESKWWRGDSEASQPAAVVQLGWTERGKQHEDTFTMDTASCAQLMLALKEVQAAIKASGAAV
eukprot:TRINITY_DN3291_c0_g1_i1.p1 TRINITY_DN3291_c0_g1~~TRINITY_DN3291_c0_g1_i1.p1  ORF type:complete len:188 (+),score=56.84 TRINITY_DN3291_c0_g1_i1:102-665(+)